VSQTHTLGEGEEVEKRGGESEEDEGVEEEKEVEEE
jgi:hypothetical protein